MESRNNYREALKEYFRPHLDELCEGKLKLMVRSDTNSCCWNYICASYDKEELKNKFKEFLTPKPV